MHWFITPAYAQAAGGAGAAGAQVMQFLPLVLIFVVFYFLMIRPQQQQQKTLKAEIAAVKRGDRVLTAGGIVGVVQKVRDTANELDVEIAPNVKVIVARDTLSMILKPTAANDLK